MAARGDDKDSRLSAKLLSFLVVGQIRRYIYLPYVTDLVPTV